MISTKEAAFYFFVMDIYDYTLSLLHHIFIYLEHILTKTFFLLLKEIVTTFDQ